MTHTHFDMEKAAILKNCRILGIKDTSVPFVAIILKKNGCASAVLSAIFYVLHSAKLRQMPSSTILIAIICVVKLRWMDFFINCN